MLNIRTIPRNEKKQRDCNLFLWQIDSEFHKTGAVRAKVRFRSVEQLTSGTNRRDCEDKRRV